MPLIMKPNSVIEARLGIQNGGRTHAFFTSTCAKAMDKFVPFDSGDLATTVIEGGEPTTNVTTDTITYTQKYARYQYYGVRKDGSHQINEANRNRSMHPLATSYWDKKMWSANGTDVIKQTQDYLNRGGK